MSEDMLRVCMLTEQRMAVTMGELRSYKDYLAAEGDNEVPLGLQHIYATFVATGTAQGLVGLRAASDGTRPSDENWGQLLVDSNYTILPPGLVSDVECTPPIDNRELIMGAVAAVIAVGSAALLGALATMPMVWAVAMLFALGGLLIRFFILPHGAIVLYLGVLLAANIPNLFSGIFTSVAHNVYNAIAPNRKSVKACPTGILNLGGGSPMICLDGMDKLEAKRLTCPNDESNSMVVSCEPEFNGVVALRGEPC